MKLHLARELGLNGAEKKKEFSGKPRRGHNWRRANKYGMLENQQ